jgi:hypothetical protein
MRMSETLYFSVLSLQLSDISSNVNSHATRINVCGH